MAKAVRDYFPVPSAEVGVEREDIYMPVASKGGSVDEWIMDQLLYYNCLFLTVFCFHSLFMGIRCKRT
jgi:hypothetical protein